MVSTSGNIQRELTSVAAGVKLSSGEVRLFHADKWKRDEDSTIKNDFGRDDGYSARLDGYVGANEKRLFP